VKTGPVDTEIIGFQEVIRNKIKTKKLTQAKDITLSVSLPSGLKKSSIATSPLRNWQVDHTHGTSISANAGGPRDAASRKIDHIALPTEYNYQAMSVDR